MTSSMSLLSEASDSMSDLDYSVVHEPHDASIHNLNRRSINFEAEKEGQAAEQASRQSFIDPPSSSGKVTKVDLYYVTKNIISMAAPRKRNQNCQDDVSPDSKDDDNNDNAEDKEMIQYPKAEGSLQNRDASIVPAKPQSPLEESNDFYTTTAKVESQSHFNGYPQTGPRQNQNQEHLKKQKQSKSRSKGNCPRQFSSFLNNRHQNHYLLFNISSKPPSSHMSNLLNNQIVSLPWTCPGINSPTVSTAPLPFAASIPTLKCLLDICYAMDAYLQLHPQNIAAVYCSNGKTRTGIAVAAYLKFSNSRSNSCGVSSSLKGFRLFCSRTCAYEQIDDLIPPSLKTLFVNFDALVECGGAIQRERLVLRAVTLQGLPVDDMPRLDIWDERGLVFTSHKNKHNVDNVGRDHDEHEEKKILIWADEDAFYRVNKIISGDFLVLCRFGGEYAQDTDDPTKVLLRYANNSSFLYPSPYELPKTKVDIMRRYADEVDESDFLMTFQFESPGEDTVLDEGHWNDLPSVLGRIDALHRGWSIICQTHAIDAEHEINDEMENDLILLQKYYHGEVSMRTVSNPAPNLLLMTLALQISNGDIDRAVNILLENVMKSMWKDRSSRNPFSVPRMHHNLSSISSQQESFGNIPQCLSAVVEGDSRDISKTHSIEEDGPKLEDEDHEDRIEPNNSSFMNMLDGLDFSSDSDQELDKNIIMTSAQHESSFFYDQVVNPQRGDVAQYLGYDDSSSSSSNSSCPFKNSVTSSTLGRRGNKRRCVLMGNHRARKKRAKERQNLIWSEKSAEKDGNKKHKSAVEELRDIEHAYTEGAKQVDSSGVVNSEFPSELGFDDRYHCALMDLKVHRRDITATRSTLVSRSRSRVESTSYGKSIQASHGYLRREDQATIQAKKERELNESTRTDCSDSQERVTKPGQDRSLSFKSRSQRKDRKRPIRDLGSLDAFTSPNLVGGNDNGGSYSCDFGEKVKLIIGGKVFEDGRIVSKDSKFCTIKIPLHAFKDGKLVLDKTAIGAATDSSVNTKWLGLPRDSTEHSVIAQAKNKNNGEEGSKVSLEVKVNVSADGATSKEEEIFEGEPLLKDDPVYVKYFRMLKMGLPIGAVKNAMTRDDKDPSIIDLDPNKTLKSQVQIDSKGGDNGPMLKDDPEYEKYFKMSKMGLPIGAVKNALTRDGKDPSIMDLDPNQSMKSQKCSNEEAEGKDTGTPLKDDPEYGKYFKMSKMGLPIGAVKNALTRDGKDPSIMDLDPNQSIEFQMREKTGSEAVDTGVPLKDDPEYEKYFKMSKMGLPIGAVKNALTRDGKDPSIMDLDPNQSIEFQMREKTGSEAVDTGVPLKDDPEYEKYFKMSKMGLPIGAVKNALTRDGKDPSIMDLDPNQSIEFQMREKTGSEAVDTGVPLKDDPEYEKYFKMSKMGLPVGAVQNALQRDGKDPSIMDLDPNHSVEFQLMKKKGGTGKMAKKEKKVKVRRKKIYWNTLDKSKVKRDSLWGQIRGMIGMEKLKIDSSEFESLFTETFDPSQKKKKKANTESDAAKPKKSVQVIEGKRGMNGGIILARVKMDFVELARIVDHM